MMMMIIIIMIIIMYAPMHPPLWALSNPSGHWHSASFAQNSFNCGLQYKPPPPQGVQPAHGGGGVAEILRYGMMILLFIQAAYTLLYLERIRVPV